MEQEQISANEKLTEESLKQIEFHLILDYISKLCLSDLGKDLIHSTGPVNDFYWLNLEHDLINELTYVITEDDIIPFNGFSDIKSKLHKSLISNAALSPEDILKVKDFIRTSRLLKNYFKGKTERYSNLARLMTNLFENRFLEKHIDDSIDETANIRDSASRELSRIRKDILEKSARLRSRMEKILKRVSSEELLQEDYISLREGRLVLPVKAENKRQIPGIIHGVSQTGSTVFLEPSEIIEMNNELSLLYNEEKREIYRILMNLTAEIGDEAREILSTVDVLAHFDSVLAKAHYALKFGGLKPKITEDNTIFLHKIRHPLLVHAKGSEKVMPLSIEFNNTKRGHLISGPNAGGKTVALKSIGLNVAMALSGIFPLGECHTNFRSIFCSLGDNQSIENDLSTFSSQMLQLKKILDACTNESLVLIDEIGSGTDPQEGSALAAGILDSFIEMNLFFVATTHQSSLKSYALARAEISNASLEFNEKELKPNYKFLPGVPGNSYAFILSENIGISKLILDRARKYVGTRQTEIEESIKVLQTYISETDELRKSAERDKMLAEKNKLEFEQKLKEIKTKRKELINEARIESEELLKKANSLIENTIREIREEKKPVAEIKKGFQAIRDEIRSKIKSDTKQSINEDNDFSIGENVKLIDSPSIGNILEIDTGNLTALVDFNGVKFRLPFEQLEKTVQTKQESRKGKSIADNIRFDAKISIDLRGMRVDECIKEVDDFISQAILGNVDRITLIHGKGTGALRQVIKEFLTSHQSVKSFRTGTLPEGGDGVTLVEL